ncbi:MAG: hypothetical protein M1835_002924 [Candelina submexicana]|nr:MAG: hypothetical protein M1835_002924 [Candelina submexicana]
MGSVSESKQPSSFTETVPDAFGGRFVPGMFTLSVGPNEQLFEVHKTVLCQSPVFAAMCSSKFKEAHDKHVKLPEDDPEDVGKLVQYLYAQDFGIKASEDEP